MNKRFFSRLGLSPLYTDGMVIQRGEPFPLRGHCEERGTVTVVFRGNTYTAQTDEAGEWRLTLCAMEAGGPFTLEVRADGETTVINDVYVGDVWFCGGQSNMEMQMPRVRDTFPKEWAAPGYPLVREFRVPQEWDFHAPRATLGGGEWRQLSRETLDTFSAVTYFFAKDYTAAHHVAVGLINASWGGSPAEAWMSAENIAETFPYKLESARRYAHDNAREKALAGTQRKVGDWEQSLSNADTGLQNHWEKDAAKDDWRKIDLPAAFAETDPLENFCGSVWFERTFTATKEAVGKPLRLWLGTIADSDHTYINGVFVGGTAYRYPPRKYAVPPGIIHEGENRLVIRVVCNDGKGEFTPGKPYLLFAENDENAHTTTRIDLAGTWRYKIAARCDPRPEELFLNREATGLYNAMIHPTRDYPVKGILYYQAESNEGKPHEYETLFKTLIAGWRTTRGNPNLPFIFVQLPVWGKPSDNDETHPWAILRDAQAKALTLPRTAMAVGLDAGEWNDLHPVDKKTVGKRLFLAVEKCVFGADNTSPGPLPARHHIEDGVLTLTFTNCADGLTAKAPIILTLVTNGAHHPREATITGRDTLRVNLGPLTPERILYAWAATPKHAGLFNTAGLPAAPFRLTIRPASG